MALLVQKNAFGAYDFPFSYAPKGIFFTWRNPSTLHAVISIKLPQKRPRQMQQQHMGRIKQIGRRLHHFAVATLLAIIQPDGDQ